MRHLTVMFCLLFEFRLTPVAFKIYLGASSTVLEELVPFNAAICHPITFISNIMSVLGAVGRGSWQFD